MTKFKSGDFVKLSKSIDRAFVFFSTKQIYKIEYIENNSIYLRDSNGYVNSLCPVFEDEIELISSNIKKVRYLKNKQTNEIQILDDNEIISEGFVLENKIYENIKEILSYLNRKII